MNRNNLYNTPLIDDLLVNITPNEFAKTEKRMLLAARIDEAIKAKGWKKNQFAKKMGKKPSEISKWLSGTHNFTADTLFEIERVLNINLINLGNKPGIVYKTYELSVSNMLNDYSNFYWKVISVKSPKHASFRNIHTLIANQVSNVNYSKESCR
jgi:transcriptional regulator with XRE-family HTH domain